MFIYRLMVSSLETSEVGWCVQKLRKLYWLKIPFKVPPAGQPANYSLFLIMLAIFLDKLIHLLGLHDFTLQNLLVKQRGMYLRSKPISCKRRTYT